MKKISSFLVVLLLMLASFTAGMEYPRGDVNYDGQVSIKDVTCLIDYLLTDTWPDEPVTPPDEHEYVDLGLPSGTLWATCNVGANVPEEFGDFFAWGETEPKEGYSWETYKWCNGSFDNLTKYCTNSSEGIVDNNTELEPEDDAAYVNWGSSWRMPTTDQQTELRTKCTWTWTTRKGVNGRLVTGPNGASLFLPASGYRNASLHRDAGYSCFCWSRSLSAGSAYAYSMDFDSLAVYLGNLHRNFGFTVRAVRVSD